MSLINDMLQDLDRRKRNMPAVTDGIAENLKVQCSTAFNFNKKNILVGLFASFVLLNIIMFFWMHHAAKKHQHRLYLSSLVSQSVLKNFSAAKINQVASPVLLTGVTMQNENNQTSIGLLLDKKASYTISENIKKNEYVITLEHTHLLSSLPKFDYTASGISHMSAFTDKNDNLKLLLQLDKMASFKNINLSDDDHAPELKIQLAVKPDAVTPAVISDTSAPLGLSALNDSKDYNRAMDLIKLGQTKTAEQILEKLLAVSPEYLPARKTLSVLLLGQNKNNEAEKIISVGLLQHPDDLNLVQLEARALVNEGNTQEALNLLIRSAPSLKENPNYHALVAALYQKTGKAVMAANLYNQLLATQPNNALWWMGLGVSLETSGNRNQAIEAYNHAENLGTLSPELSAYVASRIQQTLS